MLSYWEKEHFRKFDTVIVGAGLTGLHTAYQLKSKDPERRILVLEKASIPTGASTKNAGFACFGSVTEILDDLQSMPEAEVVNLVQQRWQGLQLLKEIISPESMQFTSWGGFELLSKEQEEAVHKMESVNQLLAPIFGKDVFCERNDLIEKFGFNQKAVQQLIYNPFEGQLNPYRLVSALTQKCRNLGVEIITGEEVVEVVGTRPYSVRCKSGFSIETSQVIICTNAFASELAECTAQLQPGRGQVLVTEPIENLKVKGVFHWEEGYYYFRNYRNRIVFGGGRQLDFQQENTKVIEVTETIQNDLEQRLQNVILPNTQVKIEHRWAGIMAFGATKKTQIEIDQQQRILGVGLNGMGVALSAKVGEEIAILALNQN